MGEGNFPSNFCQPSSDFCPQIQFSRKFHVFVFLGNLENSPSNYGILLKLHRNQDPHHLFDMSNFGPISIKGLFKNRSSSAVVSLLSLGSSVKFPRTVSFFLIKGFSSNLKGIKVNVRSLS